MQKVINVNLDIKRATAQPAKIPSLVVGDTGNKIIITMYDEGAPADLSSATRILAVFSKVSDGSICEQDTDDAAVNLERVGLTVTGSPSDDDFINVMWTSSEASTSITASDGLSVSINREIFAQAYPEYGTYSFHYVTAETRWLMGEHTVKVENNIITIDPVRTGSYGNGKNNVEIQIYTDEELITSAQFNFDGRPAILNDDTIKSTEKFPILLDLIRRVEAAERSSGDMSQVDYDSNGDGIVNAADYAEEAENANNLDGHGSDYFTPEDEFVSHASRHATEGDDPIAPSDIGAAVPSSGVLVSLSSSSWAADGEGYSQTVNVSGVTQTNNIVVSAAVSYFDKYNDAGIRAVQQYSGQVKFYATSLPEETLGAVVLIVG